MSQLITSTQGQRETDKQQTIQYAYSLADRFKQTGHNATREKCATFYLLLDLNQFYENLKLGHFDISLEIMERLDIFPLKQEVTVDSSISKFHTLEEEVRRCVPDTIIATMVSCLHLFVCLFVCLSVCLFVCLFVCLSVCLFVCLFVCLDLHSQPLQANSTAD